MRKRRVRTDGVLVEPGAGLELVSTTDRWSWMEPPGRLLASCESEPVRSTSQADRSAESPTGSRQPLDVRAVGRCTPPFTRISAPISAVNVPLGAVTGDVTADRPNTRTTTAIEGRTREAGEIRPRAGPKFLYTGRIPPALPSTTHLSRETEPSRCPRRAVSNPVQTGHYTRTRGDPSHQLAS